MSDKRKSEAFQSATLPCSISASRLLPLLLFLFLTGAAQAQDFTYTSNGTGITITGYTGTGGEVIIPDTINGLPVVNIGNNAFRNNTSLTGVTIPNSVTTIGDFAFNDCYGLTSVTIGNNVASIGNGAFLECLSLTSITIPDSVNTIGAEVFWSCHSLTSITVDSTNPSYGSLDGVLFNKDTTTLIQCPGGKTGFYAIPDSVTTIGSGAFLYCSSLTSITIPDSVTIIVRAAFLHCSSLTSITIPDSVNTIGDHAFRSCTGLTSVTIGNNVTSIGDYAFYRCTGLASVTIPNSVTNIGDYAFQYCTSLTSVTIPDSVTSIGAGAFSVCNSLTSVTIGNSVIFIGSYAFEGCSSLPNITIPDSVTSIGAEVFRYCSSLTSITVDSTNPSYSSLDGVLFNKDTTTLLQCPGGKAGVYAIPDSVTTIGEYAFSHCTSLTSITIGNSVTSIGAGAFSNCTSLTSITVDTANNVFSSLDGVLFNKDQTTLVTFPGGKAGSYTIPDSVTTIGSGAFYRCTSLTSVTIGNSVTSIGNSTFRYCSSLTGVYFEGDAPSPGDNASTFDSAENVKVYYLPGTAGWGSTYGGRPTVLWDAQVETTTGLGIVQNQLGFIITGAAGLPVAVEASNDLKSSTWNVLATYTLETSPTYFSDPELATLPSRFYRIRPW